MNRDLVAAVVLLGLILLFLFLWSEAATPAIQSLQGEVHHGR